LLSLPLQPLENSKKDKKHQPIKTKAKNIKCSSKIIIKDQASLRNFDHKDIIRQKALKIRFFPLGDTRLLKYDNGENEFQVDLQNYKLLDIIIDCSLGFLH
jgi:hypothetical protein